MLTFTVYKIPTNIDRYLHWNLTIFENNCEVLSSHKNAMSECTALIIRYYSLIITSFLFKHSWEMFLKLHYIVCREFYRRSYGVKII